MMHIKKACKTLRELQNVQKGNPILHFDELIPDVEARVYDYNGEERVYLYGSRDKFESKTWCSHSYKVFSSPASDLLNWTDHGVSFASRKGEGYVWNGKNATGISWNKRLLFAPDSLKIGNLYYLVTCSAGGTCLGMAVSETPEGPFSPAEKILYDDGSETSSIDPALYTEEINGERKVYLFWGQRPSFNARGLLGAELLKDENGIYRIVKSETERVLFTGENDDFGFYEGASLRKIKDKYYILYPSDKGKGVHTMSYAVSDSPLGDYKFGGNILENDGCDVRSGNNHGSLCEINGQWYIFYHRGFNNGDFHRRVCVEKIYFDENGKIGDINGNEVEMTNHGFNGSMNPFEPVGAVYATRVRVGGFKESCYLVRNKYKLHELTEIHDGNCVEFKDFDFGDGANSATFKAILCANRNGCVDVVLDNPNNEPICTVDVHGSRFSNYREFTAPASVPSGIHTVYLRFHVDGDKPLGTFVLFQFNK